ERDDKAEVRLELALDEATTAGTAWDRRIADGFGEVNSQWYRALNGKRCDTIVSKKPLPGWRAFNGSRSYIESKISSEGSEGRKIGNLTFVLPEGGGNDPKYDAVSRPTTVATTVNFASPVDEHAAQCSILIAKGYRPMSIDAKYEPKQRQMLAASVWEKIADT